MGVTVPFLPITLSGKANSDGGKCVPMTGVGQPMVKKSMDIGSIAPGEVLVRIAGCGVCHTDLDYYYNGVRTNHPLPLALGHEISGRVLAAGAGAEAWIGKAVIIPAVMPCDECDLCKRGKGTICRSQKMPGYDIQGGFATHINVPSRGLCEVDEARLKAAGLELSEVSAPRKPAVRSISSRSAEPRHSEHLGRPN